MIPIGFTGGALDRADNLRIDAERIATLAADPAARVMRQDGGKPVLDDSGRLVWAPIEGEVPPLFLGLDAGAARFAELPKPDGDNRWAMFAVLERMAPGDAAVWGAARSLAEWHSRHAFCSACGGPSILFRAGWGRKCPDCDGEHYPRVDPVVIMLAELDGRVLVGRQPAYPPGRYSALAGFVEPGESIEEAVAREIKEEAGIDVGAVRYVASQPWPFPGSLMIACIANALSHEIVIDKTELDDAKWVDRDGVRAALAHAEGAPFLAPPPIAIAHSLFLHWLAEPLAASEQQP